MDETPQLHSNRWAATLTPIGVHKALDQVGAFAGPLLVAAMAAVTGALWPALALLAVPRAASIGVVAVAAPTDR